MKAVMEPIEIVLCTDHRYIMPAGVMMYSVCKNNKDGGVRFHVIVDESVTEEDRADLRDVAGRSAVFFYEVDGQAFQSMPLVPHISHATYYKLLIPQILSEDIHKVLYLDSDIIVRHSLLPLWETVIDGYALAAVMDVIDSDIRTYNRLKYPSHFGYFNAGMFLFNLKYWRDNDIYSEVLSYVKNHSDDILYCEQDILNYVLRERKRPLPIKYNFQSGFLFSPTISSYDFWKYEKEIQEARKDPVILHYTLKKPWEEGCDHPYRSTFLQYQNETKWKGNIWLKPQRPFLTKVYFHADAAILRALIRMRLIKVPAEPQKPKMYLDLPPID